jgi:hypothetical protein
MIKYTLKCENDHAFDSWFQSAQAFETLQTAGHVSCIHCGSAQVSKALMAPRVRPARAVAVPSQAGLSEPQGEVETALAKMRKHVEENSADVGSNFAKEAREMHLGDAPERSIYGSAGIEEAKALIEDGVPILPLPFMPKAKTN